MSRTVTIIHYLPNAEDGDLTVPVEVTVTLEGSFEDGWHIEGMIVAPPVNCCWLPEDGWTQEAADAYFWDRETKVLDAAVGKIWSGT